MGEDDLSCVRDPSFYAEYVMEVIVSGMDTYSLFLSSHLFKPLYFICLITSCHQPFMNKTTQAKKPQNTCCLIFLKNSCLGQSKLGVVHCLKNPNPAQLDTTFIMIVSLVTLIFSHLQHRTSSICPVLSSVNFLIPSCS